MWKLTLSIFFCVRFALKFLLTQDLVSLKKFASFSALRGKQKSNMPSAMEDFTKIEKIGEGKIRRNVVVYLDS